jgi:hypothetical protein
VEATAPKRRKVEQSRPQSPSPALKNRLAELENVTHLQVEQLNQIISDKENQIVKLREALHVKQDELDASNVELAAIRAVYDEQQQLVADYKAGARLSNAILKAHRLVDRRAHLDQMASQQERYKMLQDQLRILKQQRSDLEEQNAYRAAQEYFDQKLILDRDGELSLQRQEIQALHKQLEEANIKFSSYSEPSSGVSDMEKAQLEAQLAEERESIQSLREQVEDLTSRLRFNEMAIKLDNISQAERLATTEEHQQRLREQFADVSSDFRAAQRELDETRAELSTVQRAFHAKLSEAAKMKVVLLDMQLQLDEQTKELDDLKQALTFERTVSASTLKAAKEASAPEKLDRTRIRGSTKMQQTYLLILWFLLCTEMVIDVEKVSDDVVQAITVELRRKDEKINEQMEEIIALKKQLADEQKRNGLLLSSKKEQDDMLRPLYERSRRSSSVAGSPFRGYGAMPASPDASNPFKQALDALRSQPSTPGRVASVKEIVLDASASEAQDARKDAETSQPATPRAVSNTPHFSRRASSRLSSITVTTPSTGKQQPSASSQDAVDQNKKSTSTRKLRK